MRKQSLHVAITALLAGYAAGNAPVAWSQQGPAASGGLEEIVVTATRREESLQQVPISIVAVTGEGLEMKGLDSLERVSQSIPNLLVTGTGGGTVQPGFTVRGIPNVGTYVDGVWQVGTAGLLNQGFVDIDRIEVLRGPQGTTFGRDSTGGAIRIWTKKPSQEFGAEVTGTLGSFDRRDVKASVNIPLTDKLLTKWTVANLYRDGYVHDITTNLNNGGINQQIFHGDILWNPTDRISWRFNYQTDRNSYTEPRIQDAVFPGTLAEAGNGIGSIDFYGLAGQAPFTALTQTAGYPGGQVCQWCGRSEITLPNTVDTKQFSSDVTIELGKAMKLQFITANTLQEVHDVIDWDNSQYALVTDVDLNRLRVFSQEIQLSGGTDRVKWVGGAYYWNQTNRTRVTRYQLEEFVSGLYDINTVFNSPTCQAILNGPLANCQTVYNSAVGPGGRFDQLNQDTQDGYALFGEATVSLTKTIDLTIGLRHHKQNGDNQPLTIANPRPISPNLGWEGDFLLGSSVGNADTPFSYSKNTGKLSLQKQFSPNIMGYIGYSEGFNSGGASRFTNPADGSALLSVWKPQTLANTEIGVRSDLANKRLRLNATLFNTIWKDIQALGPVFDSAGRQLPALVTSNVGQARARGAELEMTVVPTDKLLFNVNLGYLDTAYTDIVQTAFLLSTSSEFQGAPKHTASLGAQYSASLRKGAQLITRVDYLYQSQFWRSLTFLRTEFWAPAVPAGFDESGNKGITNMRLTYEPGGDANWNLAFFGTNLANQQLINSGFFHGIWAFDFATVGRPREFGVQMNFKLK
ncbi:MAG TPA: TonB-dependent receptor [Gammaproteobacteria bacterium]|nr:TonB-dependent receptor [Gammaproteobacteria bacterium]